MNPTYLRGCLKALLCMLWLPTLLAVMVSLAAPSFALAGTVIVITVDGGTTVPLSLLIITTVLSTLSGGTALILRIDKELRTDPGKPLARPWLFCLAHMSGSWLAGALGFIIGQTTEWLVWYKLGFVIVAAFLGAKFIEAVAERYLGRLPLLPGTKEPRL